jgi:hypothetical protein
MGKAQRFACEAIKVRRLDNLVSIRSDILPTEIVGNKKDDVRPDRCLLHRSLRSEIYTYKKSTYKKYYGPPHRKLIFVYALPTLKYELKKEISVYVIFLTALEKVRTIMYSL